MSHILPPSLSLPKWKRGSSSHRIKGGYRKVINCTLLSKTRWSCFVKCTWKNGTTCQCFLYSFGGILHPLGCQGQKRNGSLNTFLIRSMIWFQALNWKSFYNMAPRRSSSNLILPSSSPIQPFVLVITSLICAGQGNSNWEGYDLSLLMPW